MSRSPELDNWLSAWSDQIRDWEEETGKGFLRREPFGDYISWTL